MGNFRQTSDGWAWVAVTLVGGAVVLGCSPTSGADQVALKPAQGPKIEIERTSEAIEQSPWASLPRFVSGGLRCGVLPDEKEVSVPHGSLTGGSKSIRFWSAARGEEDTPSCSAPGPWCALFGPSETDREIHRLRKRMKTQDEAATARATELNRRLARAEESAERAREERLSELGKLSGGAGGIYLTNDDSMSLASPQRLIWAIDHGAPLPSELVRPHELLNYFSFTTLPVNPDEVFSVLPELSPHPMRPSDLTLGFSVRGRAVNKETRRNVNLTYVIDRSGSMAGGDRIETVKRGVKRSLLELKAGDIISMVLFDTTTCPLAQNFVVGRDNLSDLESLVEAITPRGGSNLYDGLGQGYAAANRSYQPDYSNRVLLLTDVESTGTASDTRLTELSAKNYDARRVRLSAVGIGDTVSDELLDRLTEAGKGASMFVSSPHELDAIFGTRFTSLVETVATHVHFKLELPPALQLRAFYGEEASSQKGRVQAVHFFSGTKQMYLANLEKNRALSAEDHVRLSIEYDDPDSGEPRTSEFSWRADELEMATGEKSKFKSRNLNKARMVATFGYQLRYMAEEYGGLLSQVEQPIWTAMDSGLRKAARERRRSEAQSHCKRVKGRLDAFSAQLGGETEAARIVDLWHRYCQRYDAVGSDLQLASPAAPGPLANNPKASGRNSTRPASTNSPPTPQNSIPRASERRRHALAYRAGSEDCDVRKAHEPTTPTVTSPPEDARAERSGDRAQKACSRLPRRL